MLFSNLVFLGSVCNLSTMIRVPFYSTLPSMRFSFSAYTAEWCFIAAFAGFMLEGGSCIERKNVNWNSNVRWLYVHGRTEGGGGKGGQSPSPRTPRSPVQTGYCG